MADYPDWTRLFQLAGTDITIPINIEASDITLPVSIDAATATVDVNLSAQAVDIDVNLAASAITLDVNISAQAANIDINFADQAVAVFDAAKWFAHQADQVFVYGYIARSSGTPGTTASRTVPTGKTFFVTYIAGAVAADTGANTLLELKIDGTTVAIIGGVGGNGIIFDTPIRATAGQAVVLWVTHFHASTQTVHGSLGGYDE